MKFLISIVLCLSFLYSSTETLNKEDVLVMVNDRNITKAQLDRGVKSLFPTRYYHGSISDEQMEKFEKQVLEELIDEELLFQYAQSIGLTISKKDIDKSVENLKKMIKSEAELQNILKRSGFTIETLKHSIEKEEVLKKLYKEEIETNLSESDLKKYYEENLYKFKEPQKVKLKVIYVRNDPTDPEGRTKAKKRIEEAEEKIQSGVPFGDVAAKYSTAMSRINGGDLGYIHKGMLEPSVEKVAYSMEANTTSEIIEESIGFFIVKLESKSEQNQLSFDSVKEGLKKDLKRKFEEEKKEKLLKKLISEARIVK